MEILMSSSCCGSCKGEQTKAEVAAAFQTSEPAVEQPAANVEESECCGDKLAKTEKRCCGCEC